MNPFTLITQKRKLSVMFRVNDSFWHTIDVEHTLRDFEIAVRDGWRINHCIRDTQSDKIEIWLARYRSKFRAFFEPWEVVK